MTILLCTRCLSPTYLLKNPTKNHSTLSFSSEKKTERTKTTEILDAIVKNDVTVFKANHVNEDMNDSPVPTS